MIAKRNKLNRETFPKYVERRSKWVGSFLVIQYIKQHTKQPESVVPAFAVVIPKKIVALAVKRNHLKRLIYDAVQDVATQFAQRGLTKIILTPTKNELKLDRTRAKVDIESFLASLPLP